MKTLIHKITDLKESLSDLQKLFLQNALLYKLAVSYHAAEDGGDVNTYFTKVVINDAIYVLQEDEDEWIDNITDINDGILGEEDLIRLEGILTTLLSFSSEQETETIIINQKDIITLDIKSI